MTAPQPHDTQQPDPAPEPQQAPAPAPAPAPYAQPYPAPEPTQPIPRRPRRARPVSNSALNGPAPSDTVEHPLFAAEGLMLTAGVGHMADLPPTWAAVGGVALTAASGLAVHGTHHHAPSTVGTLAAGGAATAWMHHTMATTPWSLTALCTLAVATATSIPLYGLVRRRQHEASERVVEEQRAERAEKRSSTWEKVFEQAGAKDVQIDRSRHDGDEWINGENRFDGGFSLALVFGERSNINEAKDLARLLPSIQRIAAHTLGLRLRPGAMQVLPGDYVGSAELVVLTKDVLAETYHVPDDNSPRSINDPLVVGRLIDGSPATVNLQNDPHGMFSGPTNMGKSTYLEAHACELTRCTDNRTWVICGQKPSRFFTPWMAPFFEAQPDPYTGQPCEPIFDWIAGTEDEALRMLHDAYRAFDYRQTDAKRTKRPKWEATPDRPAITILIDESPDLLNSTKALESHRGEKLTFSGYLLKVVRLARSENIHVIFLTQRGVMSMTGAEGSNIKSQVSYRAGFGSNAAIELTAVFNTDTTGVNLAALPPGGYYLETKGFTQPLLAKGLYVDEERKEEIARQRSCYARPIDEWTASALAYYEERWTRPDQQAFFRGELCENPVRTVPYTTSQQAPAAATTAVLDHTTSTAPEGTPSNGMDAFAQWMATHHPGEPPSNERFTEFVQHAWDTTSDDDKRALGLDPETPLDTRSPDDQRAAAEIDLLTALYQAPAVDPHHGDNIDHSQPSGPAEIEPVAVAAINPALDDDTRYLLAAIAQANAQDGLLLGEEGYVLSDELTTIAHEQLGWPDGSPGQRQVAAALRKVNVERLPNRPRIGSDRKRRTVYSADDLRAALAEHTLTDDEG